MIEDKDNEDNESEDNESEDNEGVWETENVSLLVANIAVAVGTTTLIM